VDGFEAQAIPLCSAGLQFRRLYFLPGKIEISQVRNLQALERVGIGRQLLHRFMVRGHWRRAAPGWTDQRVRWVNPYWREPDMAAVVERAYRLKP
jgi:hypothetical protein